MAEQVGRKLAAILVSDVVGYSRLAGRDEELTLARLRALRSDLIDPIVSVHHGRIVKRTGDGALVEFRSVVDAVRCAIETQTGLVERNAGLPPERRIEFRIGIHLGDVMEEADGDLMGDGVNIAARLETMCAPGGICLSEDAYRQVRNRLDLAVTDLGDQALKNIADPVRVYALTVGKPATAVAAAPAALPENKVTTPANAGVHRADTSPGKAPLPTSPRKRGEEKQRAALLGGGPMAGAIAAVAALVVIAAVGAWFVLKPPPEALRASSLPRGTGEGQGGGVAEAKHLSIVVLPFQNLSGDPKQDYFADGITDNLTTDLSRIRNSFVIARNTAFTYKGKAVDAKEIGKELGVRYVLEGSVARDGNRVRVNAQLIDAESGSHLWADRFEEDLADLFKLQDDVVARLANTLGYELVKAEARKASHSTNRDAIDLMMQGWAAIWRPPTRENSLQARDLFAHAAEIDRLNPEAMTGLAYARFRLKVYGWSNAPEDAPAAQLDLLARATAINPDYAFAYYVKGQNLLRLHRYDEMLEAAHTAIRLDPNLASGHYEAGQAEMELGSCAQSIPHIKEAFRLSPYDPLRGTWHMIIGQSEQCLGNNDSAIEEEKLAIDAGNRTWIPFLLLAETYYLKGAWTEAQEALLEAKRQKPNLTIKWLKAYSPLFSPKVELLRKIGLPEDEGPRLSIVVLPFQNLSGDAKQDYLADVLSDELTTYISRIPGSFVIARNTAFTYKGKPTDAKEIGKELGVRYMLEGSVQPTTTRIRTNAQLIDTDTGAHLWAEEFDTDKTDLLETEDEIVTRLARTLQVQMTDIEAAKLARAHPGNPDAQELALRCEASYLNFGQTGKQADVGFQLCERGLEIDPHNVVALTTLSIKFIDRAFSAQSPDRQADIKRADELASQALTIDPNSADAHSSKAGALFAQNRLEASKAEAETAISLNPSQIEAYKALCLFGVFAGRPEDAIKCVDKVTSLSPRDPQRFIFFLEKGQAYLMLGQDEHAVEWLRRSVTANPNAAIAYAYLTGTLELAGHDAEARETFARYLLLPHVRAKTIAALKKQEISANPALLHARERLYTGLRKAGMPER